MTASDRQWSNEWIRMIVSKIEWFYVSKETKGQSGRPIHFLNSFIQFFMQMQLLSEQAVLRCFSKKVFLKFAIFTGKCLCWSLFLVKLQAWRPLKRVQHRCFPVNIENLLRKFNLKNTAGGCFCTWNSLGIWLYKSGNWWHIFSI